MCARRTVNFLGARPGSRVVLGLISLLALGNFATAQQESAGSYPDHTVRIIVGFTPGGAPDITARYLAQRLGALWSQPVIVENKPGAGSAIAAHLVADATPDGYTLMSITNAHAVAAAISSPLPYDAAAAPSRPSPTPTSFSAASARRASSAARCSSITTRRSPPWRSSAGRSASMP